MLTTIITSKQLEILLLLYKFRFLNRQQIQTMLNHKTFNRVNAWLADLTEKNLISRTYSKKVGENVKPAVYFLNSKSKQILKDHPDVVAKQLNRIYQEKNRSPYFREKSMFLADIYLNLKGQTDGELHFLTKSNLEAHKYLYKPLPDAYIVSTTKEQTKRYFLEIVSEQVPRFYLKKHFEYLLNYFSSGKWEQYSKHSFPTFLIVAPNYVSRAFMSKHITKSRDSDSKKAIFFITTIDQIKVNGMKDFIWKNVE